MKRISEIVKPFISIIFGALLLLLYLNWLQYSGTFLAAGIIAIVFAAYYIGIGVTLVLAGDKLSAQAKKVVSAVSVSLFPLLMFLIFLFTVIASTKYMGPTAWVIAIISLVASIGLAVSYPLALAIKEKVLFKIASLFAAVFLLALLLNVLFDASGNPIGLGAVNILEVVIYGAYVFLLLNSIPRELPAAEAPKAEEPAPEEEVKEEAPEAEEKPEEKPEEPTEDDKYKSGI